MSERRFKVLVPEGNGYSDPQGMTRVIDHFKQLGLAAEFKSENGVPVITGDEYVLVTKDDQSAGLAYHVLEKHYGLIVFPA